MMGHLRFCTLSRSLLIAFYLIAGMLHFLMPSFYLPLIPPYLPYPVAINIASGVAEVLLALLVAYPKTRRIGAFGLVCLLLLFVPAHLYVIQVGGCTASLCVPAWVAHTRLWVVHPLLVWWAYQNRHEHKKRPSW